MQFELKHKALTGEVLSAFYAVYNELGYGFLENVYENALAIELRMRGHKVEQQKPIEVSYRNHIVGQYFADLVVNDMVIIELKATTKLVKQHEAQLLNYLKATLFEVGLLLNFGPLPQHIRRAYDNDNK